MVVMAGSGDEGDVRGWYHDDRQVAMGALDLLLVGHDDDHHPYYVSSDDDGGDGSSDDHQLDWENYRVAMDLDDPFNFQDVDHLFMARGLPAALDEVFWDDEEDLGAPMLLNHRMAPGFDWSAQSARVAAKNLEILKCSRDACIQWLLIWGRLHFGLPPEMALRIAVEVYQSGFYEDWLWEDCRKLTKALMRVREAGYRVEYN